MKLKKKKSKIEEVKFPTKGEIEELITSMRAFMDAFRDIYDDNIDANDLEEVKNGS